MCSDGILPDVREMLLNIQLFISGTENSNLKSPSV